MGINLLDLFSAATSTLSKSKAQLNQADEQNHDHGTNMVQIFNVITNAISQKKNDTPSNQLAYASQALKQNATSGSAALYSQALQTASQQFKGQDIKENNVVSLIQTLLAGGTQPKPITQPASSGGDLLGTLLGGLSGGTQQQSTQDSSGGDLLGSLLGGLTGSGQQTQQQESSGGDLLGSLLGGLTGGGQHASGSGSVVGSLLGSLLGGGQQSGSGGILGSLLGSLISGGGGGAQILSKFVSGPLAESPTRAASGMLVAQSLIQAAGKLFNKKPVKVAKKTTTASKPAAKKPAAKATAAKKPAAKSATKTPAKKAPAKKKK